MIEKIVHYPALWHLSRYCLDFTCGLYRKRKAFLRTLGIFTNNPSVLDIGCGTGLFANVTEGDYIGIDSNYNIIECAKKKEYKGKKTFRCVDLQTLESEKAMFDVILIVDVLHHLDDDTCIDLLKASSRLTKKYLVNYDVVLGEKVNTIQRWFMRHDNGANFRYLDEFNKLFPKSGYKIIKSQDINLGYLSTHLTVCCLSSDSQCDL